MSPSAHARRLRLGLAVLLVLVLVLIVLAVAAVLGLNRRGEAPLPSEATAFTATPQQLERGAYLALAGNCAGCHTARGGPPYAGGRPIETPFGAVHASNLTPDEATGIGAWSAAEFWRAMHNGRSKDGRLLYPAFPYPAFTLVTREDSDAIYAYLHSLPPVRLANRPHELRWPYGTQAALAVWRALYFEPAEFRADAARDAAWNRGAYLVRGLAHCSACHSGRNAFGATAAAREFGGGLMPSSHWYAPALTSADEAGVAQWSAQEVVRLLRTGVAEGASTLGPMAELVFRSTQHLSEADLQAMAGFLRTLPQEAVAPEPAVRPERDPAANGRGARLYGQHCAQCHGEDGRGGLGAPRALAGNRAVTLDSPVNLIRVLLVGGYVPATAGNPRPHGMPPFAQTLSDEEIAAVLSYLRGAWGHQAEPVSALNVLRSRQGPER